MDSSIYGYDLNNITVLKYTWTSDINDKIQSDGGGFIPKGSTFSEDGTLIGYILSENNNLLSLSDTSAIDRTLYILTNSTGQTIGNNYTINYPDGTIITISESPIPIVNINIFNLESDDNQCIIDGSPSSEETFDTLNNMCINSSNHSIGFKFIENLNRREQRGICNLRGSEALQLNTAQTSC